MATSVRSVRLEGSEWVRLAEEAAKAGLSLNAYIAQRLRGQSSAPAQSSGVRAPPAHPDSLLFPVDALTGKPLEPPSKDRLKKPKGGKP